MQKAQTVRVCAIWKASKGHYFLKWTDPVTRRACTQQTGIQTRNPRSKSKADRLAQQRETELNAALSVSGWTWDAFVAKYEREHLAHTSKDNRYKWDAVCRFVEQAADESSEITGALQLADIRPRFLSEIETLLRSELAPGSIASYMGTLRSGLSWAAYMEMMDPLPRRRRPPGRESVILPAERLIPISEESLRKMQGVSAEVVGKRYAGSVSRYLQALWLSGCRMREPLKIHASRRDCHHPVTLTGSEPMMFWTCEQKSKREGVHRITRDFASDLRRSLGRGGYLYRPRCETGEITQRHALSKIVTAIGRKAEIEAEVGKFATAKHFRTSFVQRWSARGMPIELIQDICRHSSEETTRRYYVGSVKRHVQFDESAFV